MKKKHSVSLGSLIFSLFLLVSCSQVKTNLIPTSLLEDFPSTEKEEVYWPSPGSYSEYKSPAALTYYKTVLSPQKWRNIEVLNYQSGFFAFPPLCGHRVMQYEGVRGDMRVELHRELIDGETYNDIVARRRGSDHCKFTRTINYQKDDLDIVEATGDCYIWLYGDYARKYYFVRSGNVVYTFRLLSLPNNYAFVEPDFDFFVNATIDNYLMFSPRQQLSPTPTKFVQPNQPDNRKKTSFFSKEELVSFFSPVATQNSIVH
ncbi:MAG: hypothetical protein HZA78_06965 [Candidatus Schekmanbacteria bacterium]|nr:hypothetical protein [Candidatus Schekmanbacteria bacterium]